jgi:hypothetical protein
MGRAYYAWCESKTSGCRATRQRETQNEKQNNGNRKKKKTATRPSITVYKETRERKQYLKAGTAQLAPNMCVQGWEDGKKEKDEKGDDGRSKEMQRSRTRIAYAQ